MNVNIVAKKTKHIYIPRISSDPLHFLQKLIQKTGILLYLQFFSCYINE